MPERIEIYEEAGRVIYRKRKAAFAAPQGSASDTPRTDDDAMNTTRMLMPSSLDRLVRRFRAMVEVRRELAIEFRNRDDIASAISMEAKADAYESACRELERVIAGEIPADPYQDWPESPNSD